MAEEQKAKYEIIYDMGTELYIAKVQLAELKEQDINARIMKNEMQDQLTANIKNRGQLESLEDAWRCCMLVQRMRSGNWIEKTWKEEFHLRMWQIWTLRIVPNLEALELHLQMAA